jgi:hypothetical protein
VVRPSERPVRIYVTDARLDRLPIYAAAVKARQAVSPTVWLLAGDLFADRSLAALSDGEAQVALLNRAGVDGVVLTPGWASFGLPRLGELVSQSRFYALSANLLDAAGQTVGQPFMVKRSGWAVCAVAGLALDSLNVLTHLDGVRYVAPGFAAAKAIALMRQRADLVGVMAEPRCTGPAWGADFAVNDSAPGSFAMMRSEDAGLVNCYDLSPDASRLSGKAVDINQFTPDSGVARLLDSLRAAADSVAAERIPRPGGLWNAARLGDALVRGVLAAKLADGFMCDSLLTRDFREPEDVGALVALLRDPGRLAIVKVRGDALSGWPQGLALRPGLSRARLSRDLTYDVATTVDYLQRHPPLAMPGFELSARPFWTIGLEVLQSGQVK